MKQPYNYKGCIFFPNLIHTESNSFAYVDIENDEHFLRLTSDYIRDWDRVQEALGTGKYVCFSNIIFITILITLSGYLTIAQYLSSKQYIPERIKDQFNTKTSWMMANGLQRFYEKFGKFLAKIRERALLGSEDEWDLIFSVISFEGPIILFLSLLGFSFVILGIEIIVFKFKKWQARRITTN